jgi:hypothetical protein
LAWQSLGSPELVSSSHELLDFDKHLSEYLGIIPWYPISLADKIFLVDVIMVQGLLDFNIILGSDYVYVMNVMSDYVYVMNGAGPVCRS